MFMNSYSIGQFVRLDGSGVGVVAMLPDGSKVPDEHIGVWFGTTTAAGSPIICTIPTAYFKTAPEPTIQH
jgi:hypothetical protein